jgi:hypothetical protein
MCVSKVGCPEAGRRHDLVCESFRTYCYGKKRNGCFVAQIDMSSDFEIKGMTAKLEVQL